MASYKIYRSGNNIEIYEYEKTIASNLDVDNTGYNIEKVLERLKEREEDRKEERRRQTLRENAMSLKRMAREYFDEDTFFLTLTIAENIKDIDKTDDWTKYFFKQLRKEYGKTSYVGVRELQIRGAIHYHYLVRNKALADFYRANIPQPVKKGNRTIYSDEQKEFHDVLHDLYWKHGWVTNTLLDFVDDCGAYLVKYMTKGDVESMAWQENRRLILRSADVKKVEALDATQYPEDFEAIISQFEYMKSIAVQDLVSNKKRKRVYANTYTSEYNGAVMYLDINLNRLASCEDDN